MAVGWVMNSVYYNLTTMGKRLGMIPSRTEKQNSCEFGETDKEISTVKSCDCQIKV